MYDKALPGIQYAFDHGQFHATEGCSTHTFSGPTGLWVTCRTCRVTALLESVSRKVTCESSKGAR